MDELRGLGMYYTPILRWKQGERIALRELSDDVANEILPALIIGNRKGEAYVDSIARFITQLEDFWPDRPIYLALPDNFSQLSKQSKVYLTKTLLNIAGDRQERIPMFDCRSLPKSKGLRDNGFSKRDLIALRVIVNFTDTDIDDIGDRIESGIVRLGDFTKHFDVLIDFLQTPTLNKLQIAGLRTCVAKITAAKIRRVSIGSGALPLKINQGRTEVSRDDLALYKFIIKDDKLSHIRFSDYGAFSPSWQEMDGANANVPVTYRYTVDDRWIIYKGVRQDCRALSQLLVNETDFSGGGYSYGDELIYSRATSGNLYINKGSPGSVIKECMSHHLTMVIKQH